MKYNLKRLITFILAVAMAFSLTAVTLAADTATANEDGTRVRSAADDASEPVTSLLAGDTVVVNTEADENGWVEISYTDAAGNTGTGYVLKEQLTIVDTSTTPAATVAKEEREATAVSEKVASTALTTKSDVALRESTIAESTALVTLSEGAVVTVLSTTDSGWTQVSYTGEDGTSATGYILSEELKINAIGSGIVNTRTLIIREAADDSSAIVGLAKEGDEVQIYAVSDGWYQITCGEWSGYVDGGCITGSAESASTSAGYGTVTENDQVLYASASADSEQLGTVPAGVTFQITLSDTEGWYGITYNGQSGYLSSEHVTVSDSVTSGYIMVTADTLSLRAGAGDEYASLETIPYGTLLTVQDTVGDWYVVSYGDSTGYVSGAGVSATTSEGYKTYPDRVKVIADGLALRAEASLESDILTSLDEGDVVAVSGLTDGWYKVTYLEQTGYIRAKYTVETEEAVSTVRVHRGQTYSSESSSSSGTYSSSASGSGSAVAAYAEQFLGNPYVWGGTSLTNGCDCSGFVMSVYAHFGVSLSHSSSSMRSAGYAVSVSEMQPGDIVCYSGHVGIYVGGGMTISARSESTGIGYLSVYYSTILAVRRIF